jgi:hypothetical protein
MFCYGLRKRIVLASLAVLAPALFMSCGDTKTIRGGAYSCTTPKTWKQVRLEKNAPFGYREPLDNFLRTFYPDVSGWDSKNPDFRQYDEDGAARFWSAEITVPRKLKKRTVRNFAGAEADGAFKTIHGRDFFIAGNVPNERTFTFASAMRGGKLYIFGIDSSYPYRNDVIESIRIKPLGFSAGIAEGFLRPFLLTASIFKPPLQKYAEPCSWLYGLGFGAGILFGGFIWLLAVPGSLAGICFLIAGLRDLPENARKKRAAENARREEKAKRLEEEARWKNMSPGQRLAVIERESRTLLEGRKKELSAAKREYSELRSDFGGKDPEKLFWQQMSASDGLFSPKFKDIYSDSGAREAQIAATGVRNIAKYAAAGYCVAVCEARQEDAKLSANRRKAAEYAGALKEIWEKLTAGQKKRADGTDNPKIGAANVEIPDAIRDIENLVVRYADGRKENLMTALKGYPELRKTVRLGNEAVNAESYLAAAGMTFALGKWNDAQTLKRKLGKKAMGVFNKIGRIKKDEVRVRTFVSRAKELNMSLETATEAYAAMFGDVYAVLYPEGDEGKSKAEREKRKADGGTYFSDEESEAVSRLFTAGRFLLNLADTPFEGGAKGNEITHSVPRQDVRGRRLFA